MASLNLSANGPSISKSYQSVADSSISESARGSPAVAKWALFSVSTPLVSAFQQDAGSKESVLKVQDTGEGELADLLDEFSEGKIQFAFVKVIDANTGLPKCVLIAWCGEGVPERTKGYFTSHLSTVSRFLHGYHVQITARSEADLTVEGIIQKVGDASGAKYTHGPERPIASPAKPPVSSKPVFTPLRTGGISAGATGAAPLPVRTRPNDDDGWGPDAPPVTRTNLEKVQPAYQPTRVNIQELKSEKQAEPTVGPRITTDYRPEGVVKGGYQPIGKVDIAAIRRQAREAGSVTDDRPEPVRGAYEPVGKVDIAAIRARAQTTDETGVNSEESPSQFDGPSSSLDVKSYESSRLTSLPKPKVSNRFGGSSTFTGTKPPLPGGSASSVTPAAPVGSASRTFADQGGKTPAQLWAEKKAKERGQEPSAVTPSFHPPVANVENHGSGGSEWKSSYSGKSWAPVQTTHTGRSAEDRHAEVADTVTVDRSTPEPVMPQQDVSTIRDQLTQGPPKEAPSFVETARSVPSHVNPAETALDIPQVPKPSQPPVLQTQCPDESPAPDLSECDSSPIRVAMPVAKEATDYGEAQISPATAEQVESLREGAVADKERTPGAQNAHFVSAEATPADETDAREIRALVQYDYEKAEDNEVDLREGERVTEIEMVDKDWWLGLNARGERGLFPSNYVEIIDDGRQTRSEPDTLTADTHTPEAVPDSAAALGSHAKPTAKALYDYEAAEDNELSFPEGGEIINIEFPDDDWWLGEYHGKAGLFPANYVQLNE
ncbi:putative actin binding protein [Aspergillus mulundensis]|uniref:AbpA n=1 Tax=Aspergillus mulundensis TaxID=1810919 RepID=A0A3D8QR45_9EURO|nr:AbpA [Aspergillus mulundensis]RDW64279.1 AbpA [Aspergillus mulundensis]